MAPVKRFRPAAYDGIAMKNNPDSDSSSDNEELDNNIFDSIDNIQPVSSGSYPSQSQQALKRQG